MGPAVYIILSFIFLRKPNWLHKRRRPTFIARNIAHRGGKKTKNFLYFNIIFFSLGAGESIENSLLAFDKYD
jgi:glycerophosphoryl diester phosphodiesterase